jgi:hypothetical protein
LRACAAARRSSLRSGAYAPTLAIALAPTRFVSAVKRSLPFRFIILDSF